MNIMTRVPGRPDWTAGPLYTTMMETFPEYRTKLGVLDVQRLRDELGKSHEAIYKWLRQGKLTTDNARKIVALANTEANVAALAAAERKPPKIEDFLPFM